MLDGRKFTLRASLHPSNIFLYHPNFKFLEITLIVVRFCRCITGNLAEVVLSPLYSHRSSVFACHVEPIPRYKIYDVEYHVLHDGKVVNDRKLRATKLFDKSAGGHVDKAVDVYVLLMRYILWFTTCKTGEGGGVIRLLGTEGVSSYYSDFHVSFYSLLELANK